MADPDGEVVGAAYILIDSHSGSSFVDMLAVRAGKRGRGLARALLLDAMTVARAHGANGFELSTDSRTSALGLYEKVGMRVTSTWVNLATHL